VDQIGALRVLIIEDEAIIAMLLAEVLGGLGYEVCAIEATEAGAVTAALRCRPDLMIVDVRLGDGSGISAVGTILRTGPIPHIFVSGELSTIQAMRPDAVVLRKPFSETDLVRAIRRALDGVAALQGSGGVPGSGDRRGP
jgi:CheY-like chemotaxis protein